MENDVYLTTLGVKISSLRKERGLNQLQLAQAAGMNSKIQIVRIEQGAVNSSINVLRRIADALEIPIGELVTV